jgi:hypothetical protein
LVDWQQGWDFAIPMSPHCLAIFLQHSRSAGVIAASGTAHAMTGIAANNTARAKTPTLRMSVNVVIVAAAASQRQQTVNPQITVVRI